MNLNYHSFEWWIFLNIEKFNKYFNWQQFYIFHFHDITLLCLNIWKKRNQKRRKNATISVIRCADFLFSVSILIRKLYLSQSVSQLHNKKTHQIIEMQTTVHWPVPYPELYSCAVKVLPFQSYLYAFLNRILTASLKGWHLINMFFIH